MDDTRVMLAHLTAIEQRLIQIAYTVNNPPESLTETNYACSVVYERILELLEHIELEALPLQKTQ